MKELTLKNLVDNVRDLAGEAGREASSLAVKKQMKAAAQILSREEWPQASYGIDTVDDQGEYALPTDVVKVERVFWHEDMLSPIDWERWNGVTAGGASEAKGSPRHYILWGNKIRLTPPPLVGSDDRVLTIHYRKRPTRDIRDVAEVVCSTDSLVNGLVDNGTTITAKFSGIQRSAYSNLLSGCLVEMTAGGLAGEIRHAGKYWYDSDNTVWRLEVFPAFSTNTFTTDDKFAILDVLEVPQEWVNLCEYYAAAKLIIRSAIPSLQPEGQLLMQQFEMGRREMRSATNRRHRDTSTMKIYGTG